MGTPQPGGKRSVWLCIVISIISLVAVIASRPGRADQALAPAPNTPPITVNLVRQPLSDALKQLADQTGLQLVYHAEDIRPSQIAPAVTGTYPPDVVLTRLLDDSGLSFHHINANTVSIQATSDANNGDTHRVDERTDRNASGASMRLATAGDEITTPQEQAQSESNDKPSSASTRKVDLEEVVVTGSHIRGATDSASPIQSYTRDDIDRAGVGTVAEFIQRLPQNFNGGAAENTLTTGAGSSLNATAASGVNLRGLGNDATLVLLNGHRLAPGNTTGTFVDISMIPLSAIERIDIVTDGASAIYGSDAVGGVVNFILRRDFEGAETRADFGSVTDGASHETEIGQTFGHHWSSGSALMNYEFYDRTPLSAGDRDYSQAAPLPFDLLPEQVRQSVFASLNQSLTPNADLFADGSFSRRGTNTDTALQGGSTIYAYTQPATIDAFNGTVGSRIALFNHTQLELSATYGANDTRLQNYSRVGSTIPILSDDLKVSSSVSSVDAKIDGPLFTLPAGSILYAVGGQFREETLNSRDQLDSLADYDARRNVTAGFAELHLPLIGSGVEGSAARLEVSLAGRTERYSDFGSTSNPQIGITFNPSADVKFRGTFGKSFKAPSLYDLNPTPTQIVPTPGYILGGGPNTLQIFGGNPDLKPETAKTWTAGFDVHPAEIPNLKASATYYNIRFDNQIVNPQTIIDPSNLFQFESVLGPSILQLNPPLSIVEGLAKSPAYQDIFGYGSNLSTIGAIFDSRSQNISIQTTSGIDFGLSYKTTAVPGVLEGGIDGTYILKFEDQVTPTAAATSILDTPYHPIDLKLRGHLSYTRGPVSLNAFVNYVDSYTDNRVTPSISVASWTTVDTTISYKFPQTEETLRDTLVSLAIINIANRDPPLLNNPTWPVNYDGANANPLGRFVKLQISKHW